MYKKTLAYLRPYINKNLFNFLACVGILTCLKIEHAQLYYSGIPDPFIYLGYAINYSGLQALWGHTYFASRLAVIVPISLRQYLQISPEIWRYFMIAQPRPTIINQIQCSRQKPISLEGGMGMPISWSGSGVSEVGKDQNGKVIIKIDPKYFRPTEVPFLLGDATKARTKLGWEPKYTVDMLIDDMLEAELASKH